MEAAAFCEMWMSIRPCGIWHPRRLYFVHLSAFCT